ncbi:hypothetical protein PGB90_005838 [Kerria lacca]
MFYRLSRKQLENYVASLPVTIKILRTGKRSGLIRARLLGAKHVTGQMITFLDAHCECTEGWLKPLLARIVVNSVIFEESVRFDCTSKKWPTWRRQVVNTRTWTHE